MADSQEKEKKPEEVLAELKHVKVEAFKESQQPPGVPEVEVRLKRSVTAETPDQALWVVIRNSTNALSFNNYMDFIDNVMCGETVNTLAQTTLDALKSKRFLPFPNVDAYRLLKVATEVFLIINCGVAIKLGDFIGNLEQQDKTKLLSEERRRLGSSLCDEDLKNKLDNLWNNYLVAVNGEKVIPYLALIRLKLGELPLKIAVEDVDAQTEAVKKCYGILERKLLHPCLLELIWSYWLEEGMLVQSMNAISWRFQNKRRMGNRDPLENLELDPLRPLNNLFWGHIQDEQHRLTLPRRAYEYDHHYGITLYGKAVPTLHPADSRSKFLEAFHNLLHLCTIFFKEDDDTTVIADGFPLMNGLKEVHLLLTQGQHNQYGDLPWTARQEMLMQQWLLARPEMREFLTSRIMVAYPEPWMERVDAMKKLQGWTDVSILHFRDLAKFGEQILLSIRFGDWNNVIEPDRAANWARYWRAEIQGYIHAYRAVTGADLMSSGDFTMPSVHLKKRLASPVSR